MPASPTVPLPCPLPACGVAEVPLCPCCLWAEPLRCRRALSRAAELWHPSGSWQPCSSLFPDLCLCNLSLLSIFFFCFVFIFTSQGHDDAVPCAVLKSVDSFSFLHHPVHQRSLEILQRCKEEKYSKAPIPPFSLMPHSHGGNGDQVHSA